MKKRLILISLVVVLFSAFLLMGSKNEAIVKFEDQQDIKYNNISEYQKLDIYYPKQVKNTGNPAVLFLHGGSYSGGGRSGALDINKQLFNDNGFVYVPVDYRLSGEEIFPGALDDVKSAVRYLKANSDKYKIDPNNIYIIGHSAGANLGSMVATTNGVEAFGGEKINDSGYTSEIAGFIGIAGFYDLNGFFEYMSLYGRKSVYENIIKYYGQDSYNKLKPFIVENNSNYLKNMKVPVYVIHGMKDKTVPFNETKKYCSSLKFANKEVDLKCELIENGTHRYSDYVEANNSEKIIEWLKNKVSNEK